VYKNIEAFSLGVGVIFLCCAGLTPTVFHPLYWLKRLSVRRFSGLIKVSCDIKENANRLKPLPDVVFT
jgi:hypothetical protein